MKRLLVSLGMMMVGALAFGQLATAQDASTMTDEHIEHIRAHCADTLTTLRRIKANDAQVFVTRNQVYHSISDKLMLRLNSRLALNRLDGGALLGVTADYEESRSRFQQNYKKYEEYLSQLIKMNCQKQPVSFYDGIVTAQQLRQQVRDSVIELNSYIKAYAQAFDSFRTEFATSQGGKEVAS